MKKIRFFLVTMLLMTTSAMMAQTTVKGTLADETSKEGEPFATIRVFKEGKKDKPVAMFLTDAEGKFSHEVKGKGKNVLRSRLQVEYDRKGLVLTPFANIEFFNAWSLQKVRYHVGVDWKLSKQHTLSAFYRYQTVRSDDDDNEPNRHIIGVGYQVKF